MFWLAPRTTTRPKILTMSLIVELGILVLGSFVSAVLTCYVCCCECEKTDDVVEEDEEDIEVGITKPEEGNPGEENVQPTFDFPPAPTPPSPPPLPPKDKT